MAALRGIDLAIPQGSFTIIAGPSGSGKSTLLNIIGGIEHPTSGTVFIDDTDLAALSSNALADLRVNKLGFVFQTFNLLPVLTAYENVEYPLCLKKMAADQRRRRVKDVLREVGLAPFETHRPAQLSGGQRQRVAIARALAASPKIILADEPTANLDRATGTEIVTLLKEVNHKTGVTLLMATHDPAIISQAHRVVMLQDGRVMQDSECS